MQYKGTEYTEVKDRIHEFRSNPKYEDWSIVTELLWHSDDMSKVVFKAIIRGPVVESKNWVQPQVFIGHAYEERVDTGNQFEVNRDAWLENCETSAVGRAFANMDIGVHTSGGITRPSAEEMKKVEKMETARESGAAVAKSASGGFISIIDAIGKELDEVMEAPYYARILEKEGGFKSAAEIKRRVTQEDAYKNTKGALDLAKSMLRPYVKNVEGTEKTVQMKISELEPEDRKKIVDHLNLITGI